MENFVLVLGEENEILPGKLWTSYNVEVLSDRMICTAKNDPDIIVVINYSDFQEAEFGIGSGNLWLQCVVNDEEFVFCSPRRSWKSEAGKKLIEGLGKYVEIGDMKEYKKFTGPMFIFCMFK